MDFARKQLLKYGWSEGKGLGKDESGIPEALKPQLKFDATGVGHDSSEQFTFNWWENVYNNAADNIKVVTGDDSVNVELNTDDSVDITTKKYSIKHLIKKNKHLIYGQFIQTSKLTADGIEHEDKTMTTDDPAAQVLKLSNLTDEELFKACGGRTAHKGARHGLKLNGKLARIEKQEMLLLQQMKLQANKLEKDAGKQVAEVKLVKVEKRKKHKKKKVSSENDCTNNNLSSSEDNMKKKSKKRKYSLSDTEGMDVEAAQKRREYHHDKQKRKKIKIKKRLLDKKLSKMTDMLENVCVSNILHDNKDDGFVESSKKTEEDDKVVKKKSKKKRKLNNEVTRGSEDDGFEEYISEVNEKLIYYKELRKELQNEKRMGDEKRIDKMAEEFEKCCDV